MYILWRSLVYRLLFVYWLSSHKTFKMKINAISPFTFMGMRLYCKRICITHLICRGANGEERKEKKMWQICLFVLKCVIIAEVVLKLNVLIRQKVLLNRIQVQDQCLFCHECKLIVITRQGQSGIVFFSLCSPLVARFFFLISKTMWDLLSEILQWEQKTKTKLWSVDD